MSSSAAKRPAPNLPPTAAPRHVTADKTPPGGATVVTGNGNVGSHETTSSASSTTDESTSQLIAELPDGRRVILFVDARRSMMDVLIEVCSRGRLNPANHTLVVPAPAGTTGTSSAASLPFTPSQSLQSLGANTVRVVAKSQGSKLEHRYSNNVPSQQPFEITHRVTINYPLHQKHVVRVRPDIVLSELLLLAAQQKNLDTGRHELRHPAHPDTVLDLSLPLCHYNITEVTVAARPTAHARGKAGNGTVHAEARTSIPASVKPEAEPPLSGIHTGHPEQPEVSTGAAGLSPDMATERKHHGLFAMLKRNKKETKDAVKDTNETTAKEIKDTDTSAPVHRGNGSTQERWRTSYVTVHSTHVGNGSVTAKSSSAVVPQTSSVTAGGSIPAYRVSLPAAPERKKRPAPKAPTAAAAGQLKSDAAPPANAHTSGTAVTELPTVVDGGTGSAAVVDAVEKPSRTKRRAPFAPGLPTTSGAVPGRLSVAQHQVPTSDKNVVSVVSDEVLPQTTNVDDLEPQRPKPRHHRLSAEQKPASFDVELDSLTSTDTGSKSADYRNDVVADYSDDGKDRFRAGKRELAESENHVERAVESPSPETESLASTGRQETVTEAAQQSHVEEEKNSDRGSLTDDHNTDSLRQSMGLYTYNVGDFPSRQDPEVLPQRQHLRSELRQTIDDDDSSSVASFSTSTKKDDASSLQEVVVEHRVVAEAAQINQFQGRSLETTRPLVSPAEPIAFKISETDVKQKKNELSTVSQRSYDSSWQASGDGGRFRIRSMAKNVSYMEVFGDEAATKSDTPKASSKISTEKRTIVVPTSAAVNGELAEKEEPVNAEPVGEISRSDEPISAKDDSHEKPSETDTDDMIASRKDNSEHKTVIKVTEQEWMQPADVGSEHTEKSVIEKDKSFAETNECITLDNNAARAVDCTEDVQVASPTDDIKRSRDDVDGREIVSSGSSVNSEKSTVDSLPAAAANSTPEYNSLSRRGNATDRQPEVIVIDKSRMPTVGGYIRREPEKCQPGGGARVTKAQTWSSGSAAKISTMSASTPKTSTTTSGSSQQPQTSSGPINVPEDLSSSRFPKPASSAEKAAVVAVDQPGVERKQAERGRTSTVVRIVNGNIIVPDSSSVTWSKPPQSKPPQVAATRPRSSVPIENGQPTMHEKQSENGASRLEVVTNSSRIEPVDRSSTNAASNRAEFKATGIADAEKTSGHSDAMRTAQLHTVRAGASNVSKHASSGGHDEDRRVRTDDRSNPAQVPAWRRQIAGQQTAPSGRVDESKVGGRNITVISQNAVKSTSGGTQVQPSGAGSTLVYSESTQSHNGPQIPVGYQRSSSLQVGKAAAAANSNSERPSTDLAHARSLLRPTNRQIASDEVPPTGGAVEPTPSKFTFRSASSIAERNAETRDVKNRNSTVEQKHTPVVNNTSTNNSITANQSRDQVKTTMSTSASTASTFRATANYSSSTSAGRRDPKSSAQSNVYSNEPEVRPASNFGRQLKTRPKSEVLSRSTPGVVEVEKERTEKNVKPVSSRQLSSQPAKKPSESDGVDRETANPAAAALASLQPTKMRVIHNQLPPPKLTLHEQLMNAIRDAGGTVPNAPGTSLEYDASSESTSLVPVAQSSAPEPRKSTTATTWPTSATTVQSVSQPVKSSVVSIAKRTHRVIEPPQPTPHEQLMMAIRNAGGVTANNTKTEATRSEESTTIAASAFAATSAADTTRTSKSQPPSTVPPSAGSSQVVRGNSSSVVKSNVLAAPPPPPPPPSNFSSVPTEPSRAAPGKRSAGAGSRLAPGPQQMDPREGLLAAIRGAGGVQGLRKVSSVDK